MLSNTWLKKELNGSGNAKVQDYKMQATNNQLECSKNELPLQIDYQSLREQNGAELRGSLVKLSKAEKEEMSFSSSSSISGADGLEDAPG